MLKPYPFSKIHIVRMCWDHVYFQKVIEIACWALLSHELPKKTNYSFGKKKDTKLIDSKYLHNTYRYVWAHRNQVGFLKNSKGYMSKSCPFSKIQIDHRSRVINISSFKKS